MDPTTVVALSAALFVVLLVLGAPIYVFLGAPAVLLMFWAYGTPPDAVSNAILSAVNSDALIAVPLYLMIGGILGGGTGAARDLYRFFSALVGHLPGGLAVIAVLTSVFFAGVTGSSVGEAALLSQMVGRPMIAAGYDRRFAQGLVAIGGTLGILIPPSAVMILYAVITEQSIGRLFLAGVLPGLFVGAVILVYAVAYSARHGYRGAARATRGELVQASVRAIPVLLLPVVIVGSIYSGLATVEESAALALCYGMLLNLTLYHSEFSPARLFEVLRDTARLTAVVLFIVAASSVMGWVLTYSRLPQTLTVSIVGLGLAPWAFLLLLNAFIFLLGIPLEPPPIMFMTLPIVVPILEALDVDPIHFGIIMVVNMQLALATPPVGGVLYAVASVLRRPVKEVFEGVLPFVFLLAGCLVVIIFWPDLSLALVPGRR